MAGARPTPFYCIRFWAWHVTVAAVSTYLGALNMGRSNIYFTNFKQISNFSIFLRKKTKPKQLVTFIEISKQEITEYRRCNQNEKLRSSLILNTALFCGIGVLTLISRFTLSSLLLILIMFLSYNKSVSFWINLHHLWIFTILGISGKNK